MTERGLYNQMLFVYFLLVIFGQIIEQTTPMFMTQRTLYEARERHAKTYSWVAFLCGTMTAEIMWNSVSRIPGRRKGPLSTLQKSSLGTMFSYRRLTISPAHGRLFFSSLLLPVGSLPQRRTYRRGSLTRHRHVPQHLGLLCLLHHVWVPDQCWHRHGRGVGRDREPLLHHDVRLCWVSSSPHPNSSPPLPRNALLRKLTRTCPRPTAYSPVPTSYPASGSSCTA